MANQSSAYDFALFEPKSNAEPQWKPRKESNIIELPKEQLRENRRPKTRPAKLILPFLAFLVVAGIVGSYVNGQLQLSELSNEMGAAQKTLQEQQNQYSQMKIKSDSSLSMEAVETYATQKLGMQPTSADQVTTVELTKGDKSQVVAAKTADNGWGWLQRVWQTIRGFLS